MTTAHEYDPDDNFGHAFAPETDVDDEAASEALVWQLLLLINPGDEDAALQQFTAYQETLADADDDVDPAAPLRDAIDWKSGFFVADDEPGTLVEVLDELAARWNLRIEWGLDDEGDLTDTDSATLLHTAYDRLREHHYTLWLRETGSDHDAGWITRQDDDAALRAVAGALGIHVRAAGG
jgi:hypothetical protein